MRSILCSLALTFLSATTASAQGQLWIVDETGAPGTDFTAVQPAVDAASDGDVILLRTLTADPGFTILGKSLIVTEDAGATAQTGPVTVASLSASQSVTLRGFEPKTLALTSNTGSVLVEGVGSGIGFPIWCIGLSSTVDSLLIASCSQVVLSRCSIGGTGTAGSPAVSVISSSVHMYDVWAQGKHNAGNGGDGVVVSGSSFVFASGGGFVGGCGSDSVSFPSAGDGGTGLRNTFGDVRLLEVALVAGLGGWDPFGGGTDGKASVGPYKLVAGHARKYTISGVAAGGTTAAITYNGVAGDLVISVIGLGLSPLFLPQHAGTLVVALPPILVVHGPTLPLGGLSTTVPLPPLPPGFEAFPVYVQGAAVSSVGAAVLAAPSQLTIL